MQYFLPNPFLDQSLSCFRSWSRISFQQQQWQRPGAARNARALRNCNGADGAVVDRAIPGTIAPALSGLPFLPSHKGSTFVPRIFRFSTVFRVPWSRETLILRINATV
uniref:(northern house mosquito) hypothetical protein n=1 Tax=Culex pipiens TaxID=7175 RepID=A0A8D8FMH1_CULPI